MSFIDYRRRPTQSEFKEEFSSSEKEDVEPKKPTGRPQKKYEDYSTADLEAAAEDEYERPVGTFMGDQQVKGREGDEDAYIGGFNPFGAPPTRPPAARKPAPRIGEEEFSEKESVDTSSLEREREEEIYYEPPRAGAFGQLRPDRTTELGYDPNDKPCIHEHTAPQFPTRTFVRDCFLTGFQIGSFIGTTIAFNLLVVMALVTWIFNKLNPFHKHPPRPKYDKEYERRITGERFSSRVEYYANFWGYQCEDVDVETEDGFILRLHHLTSRKHKSLGHPVILQHGILSNSSTFCVNEERSLAFWLLEKGYDVWLSNIRTNFQMPHRQRSDPRYWAWGIKEIGIYDLPAIVEHVYNARGGIKPAYIGHSQGTGTMFLALSKGMRPDLGHKLSCFVALGPAVYAGPVLRKFPFSLMRMFRKRGVWSVVMGVREFIPIISILQGVLPSWLFGHMAVPIFCFIFNFHDHNWLPRQIPKFFRTVAVATSAELLYYYCASFSYKNCIFDTSIDTPWFPKSFPPLMISYGTLDTLVLGKPLVERIRAREKNVRLVKVDALENYEHLDMVWGVNAVEDCFLGVREFIEQTKNGYPAAGSRKTKTETEKVEHAETEKVEHAGVAI
ncbi:lysosomal acid lipase/cholesteryl ester hydrolase [Pseudohyphozyma bogoriensis]|nr:lysosomal acid lipase/cholesteryl ester hydrolase [Pseudohyphozyma bogoriensis]